MFTMARKTKNSPTFRSEFSDITLDILCGQTSDTMKRTVKTSKAYANILRSLNESGIFVQNRIEKIKDQSKRDSAEDNFAYTAHSVVAAVVGVVDSGVSERRSQKDKMSSVVVLLIVLVAAANAAGR